MRWEKKKKIEQNKIDAINNLAAALKEFKKNDWKIMISKILLLYYLLSYEC